MHGFHGNPWKSRQIQGSHAASKSCRWVAASGLRTTSGMKVHGGPWEHMILQRDLWISMNIHGSPWTSSYIELLWVGRGWRVRDPSPPLPFAHMENVSRSGTPFVKNFKLLDSRWLHVTLWRIFKPKCCDCGT